MSVPGLGWHSQMDFDQLRQFEAIAEYPSLTIAAKQLNMDPSTISRSMRRLEDELECQLFDRSKKCMTLNENGIVLQSDIRSVLLAEQLLRSHAFERSGKTRAIRLGSCSNIPMHYFADIAEKRIPGVVIQSEILDDERLWNRLESGNLDVILTVNMKNVPGSVAGWLMDERVYVLACKDNPIASKKFVLIKILTD